MLLNILTTNSSSYRNPELARGYTNVGLSAWEADGLIQEIITNEGRRNGNVFEER